MRYADFKLVWTDALRDSGLGTMTGPTERLDLGDLCRRYKVSVEPIGGQDMEPFFVTAGLSWRWDALKDARTSTTEEDMLTELFGRDEGEALETEKPWLRVDVTLRATLPWGKPLPMPSQSALKEWMREVVGRLERTEPLLPAKTVEEAVDGDLAVLAWQGTPEFRGTSTRDGLLELERVELAAWEAIDLPRVWDDPERFDDGPGNQLRDLFARVRRALHVWMESLDHLVRVRRA